MFGQSRRHKGLVLGSALLLVAAGLVAITYGAGLLRSQAPPLGQLNAPTPEPLVPTATPRILDTTAGPTEAKQSTAYQAEYVRPSSTPEAGSSSLISGPTSAPSATQLATSQVATDVLRGQPTSMAAASQSLSPGLLPIRQRVGVVVPQQDIARYPVEQLGAGWYLTGVAELEPERPGRMEFAQLVQVEGGEYWPSSERLQEIARENPGALWLVGNEPDVIWQDNSSPREYARVYRNVYSVLKSVDPQAQIAIGGISQVTPLRLRYLETVLAVYQEMYGQQMPVDVWNVHLAILREERGSWGVDIPPGLPDEAGMLYEIDDNANVEILKGQVLTFRRWMAEHGLRDKPLIVTEFGVLMPPDYGFPLERVRDFMFAAFDFFLSATDSQFGHPADGNRLVQRWAWYSVADRVYSTGNLFDPESGKITPLGRVFVQYATGH